MSTLQDVTKTSRADIKSASDDAGEAQAGLTYAVELRPQLTKYFPKPGIGFKALNLSPTATRWSIVACGCSVLMLSGFNVALTGSVSSLPSYLEVVGLDYGNRRSALLIGLIKSIYWIGVITGAFLVGFLSDLVGRRKAIVTAGLYGLVMVPIFSGLQNFAWAVTLRLLNGLATGALDSVALVFVAETAESKRRGRNIGLQLVCAATEAAIAFFMLYGLSNSSDNTPQLVWRLPLAFQCVFIAMILLLVFCLPESPRYIVKVGLLDEARMALCTIKHLPKSSEIDRSAAVAQDLDLIQQALEEESVNKTSTSYLKMLYARDRYHTVRRTWSALLVQFATQVMVSVGLVSGYGNLLFLTGGWSSNTSALLTGAAILTQAVFGIPGAILSDKIGRRRALWIGAFNGSVLLCFIGICGYFVALHAGANEHIAKAYSTGLVALVLLWATNFGTTWLWVSFAYPGEIFPARSRSKGGPFGIIGFALSSFLCNMISTYMFNALGYKALFLFAGLSMIVSIVCFLFMPKTAGKTLEEIDTLFD